MLRLLERLSELIEPVKDLFLAIYFASVGEQEGRRHCTLNLTSRLPPQGMHVYPTFVANNALLLLALTTVVLAMKYLTSMLVRTGCPHNWWFSNTYPSGAETGQLQRGRADRTRDFRGHGPGAREPNALSTAHSSQTCRSQSSPLCWPAEGGAWAFYLRCVGEHQ